LPIKKRIPKRATNNNRLEIQSGFDDHMNGLEDLAGELIDNTPEDREAHGS